MKAYYEARAREYDDWYRGLGRYDGLERPHWDDDILELEATVRALPPLRTLDVACGTGFLTRHLRGEIAGLDQSPTMVELTRERVPQGTILQGDALALPYDDGAFDRVLTAHFYGHLEEAERLRFLAEARRVAPQLVVIDTARRPDREAEEWQERVLDNGSSWTVYKRYFTAASLLAELGGGRVLLENRWFVAVAA